MNNDNYNDIDYEEFREKKHGPVFRVFKWITLTLVGVLSLLLILRIYINNNVPKEASEILWDEAGYAAYTAAPDAFKLIAHPLDSYVIKETGEQVVRNNMTADAYFSFSDVCYSETVDQVQLTVRYNVSTLEHVKNDLGLDALTEGEVFLFVLEDEDGNRYDEYVYTEFDKSFLGKPRYEYRRLLFSGIRMSETDLLTLKIYYAEMPEDEPVGEIIVYDREFENAKGVGELDFTAPDGVSDLEG